MPEENVRFEWVVKLARLALIATQFMLAVALVATIAIAVVVATSEPTLQTLGPWLLAILLEIAAILWVFVLHGLVGLLVAVEFSTRGTSNRLTQLETLAVDQAETAKSLLDLATLSDQAKSLIYRDKEIDAFRETIHEDLIRQDYDTAEAIIDAIEKKLGYADEAERLRAELSDSRKATLEEKIDAAVVRIQEIIDRRDWDRATREAQKIMRLFPDNPKVLSVPDRIKKARTQHKRELLHAYGEAVRKNAIDEGIELLRELDAYLTPREGAALQESARGVFKAHLHQLGVQFAICVTDQLWAGAISVGEEIIAEFPNSRMAQEVREKLDVLRTKAAAAPAEKREQ